MKKHIWMGMIMASVLMAIGMGGALAQTPLFTPVPGYTHLPATRPPTTTAPTTTPTQAPTAATQAPTASPTPSQAPTKAPEATATALPTATPTASPTSTPEPVKVVVKAQWPSNAPEQDAWGYLVQGEYAFADEEAGVWFYASPTLVVRIDRHFDKEDVVTWYEAQIFSDVAAGEIFESVLYNPEKPQAKHVQAALIAKTNQVVFGMNTDYYTYRMGRNATVGMIIRDRKVFFDKVPETNRSKFPNLDTLAMFEDGRWGVYHSDEYTAQEYLDMGVTDVYAFGPYLVRDGEFNPYVDVMGNGKTQQPRCAIGMVEPGHYVAILAEGRLKNISVGVTIPRLAELMREAGCMQALNLDGGQTAVMTFMGEQISRIGKYDGGKTSARTTTEIMGIGHSELIDPTIEEKK